MNLELRVNPYLVVLDSKDTKLYKKAYAGVVEALSSDQAISRFIGELSYVEVEYYQQYERVSRNTLYYGFNHTVIQLSRDQVNYLGYLGLHLVKDRSPYYHDKKIIEIERSSTYSVSELVNQFKITK